MNSSSGERSPVELLAEEFVARRRRGEKPTIPEYAARYPDLAKEIRELFPALLMVEDLGDESLPVTGPHIASAGAAVAELKQLGDYRILREVGRGGMGVVYEAEQQALGRRVALKVLPPHALRDPNKLHRFEREARAAARLHHTNIVPVFGVGCHEGTHYYVMQFIQGLGLDEVLAELKRLRRAKGPTVVAGTNPARAGDAPSAVEVAQALLTGQFQMDAEGGIVNADHAALPKNPSDPAQPLSSSGHSSFLLHPSSLSSESGRAYWQSVARIGVQTAEALAYAHGQGVLHRDIKPSNLLLDLRGTVWVADFGLAKAASDGDDLTHTGDIIGTIRYMAPERFRGRSDGRSDVYSLGLTLYELLALRPAFLETDRSKLIHQVTQAEPPPPRQLNPTVPRDLETIVLKAMAPEPAHRYQSAAELAEDLQRFVDDRPIRARRVSPAERFGRWCRRNPALASLTAALALLLTAVAFGATGTAFHFGRMAETEKGLRIEAQDARQDAEQAKEAALDSEAKSRQTLVEMSTSYGLVSAERNDPGQAVLWFAHAARLAGPGKEEEQANRARVTTWSRQALQPIRALPHAEERLHSMAFHPDGHYLLTQTVRLRERVPEGEACILWDLVRENPLAWPAGIAKASSAAWTPDGRQLALGTPEGEVVLCTFPAGAEVRRLPSGRNPIQQLRFSPDGHYLAIAGGNTARVWNCQAEAFATPELEHPRRITTLTFHPRGHRLVTGCVDHKARVFPIPTETGEPLFEPVGHNQDLFLTYGRAGPIVPAFVDEGRGLLTVPAHPQGGPRQVNWLHAESGALEHILKLPAGTHQGIYALGVSPDGKTIAIGSSDGAQIWEVAHGERAVSPFLRVRQRVTSLAFSLDGRTLLMGSADHTLRRWSVPDGQPVGGPLTHPTVVTLVTSSADGRFLATAQQGGLVRIWATPTDNPRDYLLPLDGLVSRGLFSRDGRFVLPTGGTNRNCSLRSTRVYEVATGTPAGPSLAGSGLILDAAFSPDGRQVAALVSLAGYSQARQAHSQIINRLPGLLKLWDWRTGELTAAPLTLPSEPRSLEYSPNGQRLAVLCASGQVLMIDPVAARILTQWQADVVAASPGYLVNNGILRFSPDGQSVVTFGVNAVVRAFEARVWEAATGQERYAALPQCYDAQFSADGRFLVTTSAPSSVRIWEVATGQPLADPLAHPSGVLTAVFSPDGTQVLTGCSDGMARLWDWRAGRTVWAFEHEDEVYTVAFHPKGRWVLTASRDGVFRVWDGRTGKPVTPPLPTGGSAPMSVAVTPDGNYAVVGDWAAGGTMSALAVFYLGDLTNAATLDPDDLCVWGEILSGRRVHEGSGVTNLTAEEWLARWRAFRQRHPDQGRLDPPETLAQTWREAAASEAARQWPAAIRYLDGLITAHPTVGLLYYRRGAAYVELEEWDKATADYARASELRPDDVGIWDRRAHLCLIQGDEEGYRRICADVLQRFGEASGFNSTKVNLICTLRPNAVPDPSQLMRIEERAVANRLQVRVQGRVLYRAGRFEEAIQRLNEDIAVSPSGPLGFQMRLFLAMAHHHLGHAAEARQWLDKAIQWEAKTKTDAEPLVWEQRLELQLLRREAQELIEGKAAEPKK
jgi:serine/threonine protein kinase/WD40 repeat protein/tetratricopeptide (TPR) repeat protein